MTKMLIPLIILTLVLSYLVYLFPSNYVPPPSSSSFKETDWMSFIPLEVDGFRYLNITALSLYPNLFSSDVLLSIPYINLNISISDVRYGLDMLINEDTIVSVIALNPSVQNKTFLLLNMSSLDKTTYKNVTLYLLPVSPITSQGSAWICMYKGALILSESEKTDAIKLIIDSDLSRLFTNETLKIGYLLSSLGDDQLSFSYFKSGNNSYRVDWEMRCVKPGLTVRYLLHFPSSSDVDSKYSDVVRDLFAKSKTVYRSDHFIFGDFSYSPSEIRSVLMGL